MDSRIGVRLPKPKSKLMNPGPRTAPFGSFPKVPGVGYTKALVLNHCVRVFGPLALAIWLARSGPQQGTPSLSVAKVTVAGKPFCISVIPEDRKSTRLNSSHGYISYAVFCLKKKTPNTLNMTPPASSEAIPPAIALNIHQLTSVAREESSLYLPASVTDIHPLSWPSSKAHL